MTAQTVPLAKITVPAARRKVLHPETVRTLAGDILRNGLREPVILRPKGKRFLLVEGLHRLEAVRWLERETIEAVVLPPEAES